MFDKEYVFKGTHADKVIKLTAKFDSDMQIFKRNYDVYFMAPIVGFLFQNRANPNNGDGGQNTSTKIFPEILINNQGDLIFNYRLIMLLDKRNAPDIEVRIEKAFRNYNSDRAKEDENLYDQYVLGGIDILYEKLISKATNTSDYLNNLYDFMEEMEERYNQNIDSDRILELCKTSRI